MKGWILKERWRIIPIGVLITAVPLLGLSAFVNLQLTAALKDRLIKETRWFSTVAAHHVQERLRSDINYGRAYATRPYLLEGLRKGDKKELDRHLKDIVDNSYTLERAFITNPAGIQLANYPETPETLGKDFSDRDWYKGVTKNRAPYVSEFYMRMAKPQRYLFAIAIPMRLERNVIGILVMQPKEDYIKEALGGIDIGKGHIYVVDRKGHLIYHQDFIVDRIVDFSQVPIVQKVLKGRDGVEEIIDPTDKGPVFSAYHPVREWGWGVVVDKPAELVLAPVRRVTLSLAGITVLMLLLGGFFAYRWAELLAASKKAEEALQKKSEELDRYFTSSLDLLCIADTDGYFRRLNPEWEKALGYPVCELEGRRFLEFVHPDDVKSTLEAVASLSSHQKEVANFINRYRCKDGSYRWLEWRSHPEGKLIYATARDITERRKLEDEILMRSAQLEKANSELHSMNAELQAMNEELQTQQKELQEANARLAEVSMAKSDFLANMSHELRTPLNSIIGFSEVLKDELYGKLNEKQREYVDDIMGSGRHLLDLINDILDLAKVESGKMELEASVFSLNRVLHTSMTMMKEKATKHCIAMNLEIEEGADTEIEADERKFKQIMFNLLSNAVKFTPDGGSVSVKARRLSLRGAMPAGRQEAEAISRGEIPRFARNEDLVGDFVEVSVSDTGIGIKAEDIPKLFKEFTQLESPYTKDYEGAGLGLALTKKLVELHGGTIWVESEPDKGSRFAFTIPVKQPLKPESLHVVEKTRRCGCGGRSSKRSV